MITNRFTISSAVGAAGVHALYEFGYGETGEVLCMETLSLNLAPIPVANQNHYS